ncbi:MAG: ATP-binding protein [Bacteroidetes bacterium]|nr:ATP-binding protein [Bacteroidota bacterium]
MKIKPYIKRNSYFEKIKPFINKDLIKVITGQRRVGKSYFLNQVMDFIQKDKPDCQIIYINKELDEYSEVKDYKNLLDYVKINCNKEKSMVYLFIDEIQDILDFERALRSLLAEGGYDIYITGSNAAMLSGDLSTYLSGRYIEVQIYSLSFSEFMNFHNLEKGEETLIKYIKYGGLPYLKNLELNDNIAYEYIKSIYNTIVLKDIVARYQIRNVFLLDNLNRFLADNVGSLLSAKRISDFLKSQNLNYSPKVIINYLGFLTNSFFVYKVYRANIKGRKIFEINKKYYFEDLGLRHTITRFTVNDINKVLENLVYKHLIICGYQVVVGQMGNKEIDFWCEKQGKTIYVQVAYQISDEKTQQREFGNLIEIQDNYPKYVVTMDKFSSGSYKGIEHVHIIDFLTNDF